MDELTDLERDVLAFEGLWWQRAGSKEVAMRVRFDLTPTAYYRRVNQLINRPAALVHAPVVVKRLRRLRDERARRRHQLAG